MYRADTIVARATAAGRAAIAIIRLSGPESVDIASRFLRSGRSLSSLPAWRLARFAAIDPADLRVIDEVIAVRMPGPRSYTGEDVVEVHCHGSCVVVDTLLRAAMIAGARAAEPGEFTRRAVLNGRMDLVQAEAVAELIDAPVLSGVKAAWRRLSGALTNRITTLRERLVAILADVETYIDFSDEDLPEENEALRSVELAAIRLEIERLLEGFKTARREAEGYRVVLAGKPNVGKSSLLNALLGVERAIVSEEAGTTRDTITETVDLGGFAFLITDTAGVRPTSSVSEALAVGRSLQEASDADILIRVFDGSRALDDRDVAILALMSESGRALCVINKSDLLPGLSKKDHALLLATGGPVVTASAITAGGCDALERCIVETVDSFTQDAGESTGLARERHRAALERALYAVTRAQSEDQAELAAIELRQAIAEIGGITEVLDNEQVLDVIFASFCIGK